MRISYRSIARGDYRQHEGTNKPKPEPKRGGHAPHVSDEQLLEMRALHDFGGWSKERVANRYGLDEGQVKRYLGYITRARLVAKREHLPEGV